jgi:hypothetical protein
VNQGGSFCISLADLAKYFMEECLYDVEFTHG